LCWTYLKYRTRDWASRTEFSSARTALQDSLRRDLDSFDRASAHPNAALLPQFDVMWRFLESRLLRHCASVRAAELPPDFEADAEQLVERTTAGVTRVVDVFMNNVEEVEKSKADLATKRESVGRLAAAAAARFCPEEWILQGLDAKCTTEVDTVLHRLAGVARAKMDVDEAMKLYVALLRADAFAEDLMMARGDASVKECADSFVSSAKRWAEAAEAALEGDVAWLARVWLDKAERKLWLVQKADATTLRVRLLLRGADACMKTGLHDQRRSRLEKARSVFETGRAERSDNRSAPEGTRRPLPPLHEYRALLATAKQEQKQSELVGDDSADLQAQLNWAGEQIAQLQACFFEVMCTHRPQTKATPDVLVDMRAVMRASVMLAEVLIKLRHVLDQALTRFLKECVRQQDGVIDLGIKFILQVPRRLRVCVFAAPS
jgi:hypothetical protein